MRPALRRGIPLLVGRRTVLFERTRKDDGLTCNQGAGFGRQLDIKDVHLFQKVIEGFAVVGLVKEILDRFGDSQPYAFDGIEVFDSFGPYLQLAVTQPSSA